MARVVALVPDLLFGSRVQAMLGAAGHEVTLLSQRTAADAQLDGTDVLIVDLADRELDGIGLLEELRDAGRLGGTATLGFYAHVEAEVRRRAEEAGFDQVVPRSRMAREGAALVERLAARTRPS